LPEVGTKNYDYKKYHTLMQSKSSGLDSRNDVFSIGATLDDSHQNVILSIAFLDRNIDKGMGYLSEILSTPNFDDSPHLADLIKTSSVEIANNIGNNSLGYGMSYANSGLKQYARRNENFSSDLFLCQLGAEVIKTSNPASIYHDLIVNYTDLASYLFREENITFAVTGDKKKFQLVELKLQMILNAICNENSRAKEKLNHLSLDETIKFEQIYCQHYFETPLNVNNNVEAFLGPGYYSEDYGVALVAANLLTHEFLHPLIREKGGAYGSGASANENGLFNMYSFWDPKLEETYENFEKSIQKLTSKEFSEKQLEQAKLATFQRLDKILEPSLKGMLLFTRGYTDEQRASHRLRVLECSKDEVSKFAEETLMTQLEKGQTSRVVFGAQLSESDELKKNGWKIEKPLEFLSSSYFEKYKETPQEL
jgi:presequence protease